MTSRRATPADQPRSQGPRPGGSSPLGSTSPGGRPQNPRGRAPRAQVSGSAGPRSQNEHAGATRLDGSGAAGRKNPQNTRPSTSGPTGGRGPDPESSGAHRPHVPLAFGYGALSAVAVVIMLMVPVFAAWTLDARSSASWNETLGVTIDLWALAHRAHVAVDGVTLVFSPLLLTLGCIWAARVGSRAAFPEARLHARDLRAIMLAFVAGYVVAAQGIGVIAGLGSSHVRWWSLLVGPVVVASLGMGWTAWREREHSPELAALDEVIAESTPLLLGRSIRSGLRGVGWFLLLGAIGVIALVAWHGERVWTIQGQLSPGIFGGLLLTLGQLCALPNLAGLFTAWTTGAPLEIGQVSLGHGGMTPGTLPMIPVLGAVPDTIHGWAWLAPLVPLAVGGYVGWDAAGRLARLSSLRAKTIVACSSAALATAALWLVWWFSAVSVKGGLLGFVGPHWAAWLLLPVLLVPPAALAALARHWRMNHT